MGAQSGHNSAVTDRTAEELRALFPRLELGLNCENTSRANPRYNCVAFANGSEIGWWQNGENGGMYYWPPGIEDTLDGWERMFTEQGYELTENPGVEPDVDKVAIYVNQRDLKPSHVAISDGKTWKSKLGRLQDISHASLDILEGAGENDYGIVERILRRPHPGREK